MTRINIPFVVVEQRISQPTHVGLISGSQNYICATFDIDEIWDGIENLKAVFSRDGVDKLIDLIAIDGGYECEIPWEVMADEGAFTVGIFGGDRLLTDTTYVIVRKGCATDGETPKSPTPDWFTRMENENTAINEKVNNIEETTYWMQISVDGLKHDAESKDNKTSNIVGEDDVNYPSEGAVVRFVNAKIQEETAIIKSDVEGIQEDIKNESHFRGYVSTNEKIQEMEATPNDFAYSAESGTVWVYDAEQGWQNTSTPVPDKGTPLSNATPLINGVASAGTSEEGARSDHRHPTDTTRASVEELNELKSGVETALDHIIAIQNNLLGVSE